MAKVERIRKNALEYPIGLTEIVRKSNYDYENPRSNTNAHKQENRSTNSNVVDILKEDLDFNLFEEILD